MSFFSSLERCSNWANYALSFVFFMAAVGAVFANKQAFTHEQLSSKERGARCYTAVISSFCTVHSTVEAELVEQPGCGEVEVYAAIDPVTGELSVDVVAACGESEDLEVAILTVYHSDGSEGPKYRVVLGGGEVIVILIDD